jgi:ADP-ribosyl-[dinitrogen reductase] hydrolase
MNEKLDRALGSLVGLVCADALGSTVEFMSPSQIKARYGEQGHTEMRGGGSIGWELGEYTDDGQMMLCLLESLLATNTSSKVTGLDVADLAKRFVAWYNSNPKDIGITTAQSIRRLIEGVPAELAGNADPSSQANGAVMRSAPVAVLWHKMENRQKLVRDSLLQAYPTHRSPIAAGASVVANLMVAEFIENQAGFEQALQVAINAANPEWQSILTEWQTQGYPPKGNSGWAVSTVLTALHCLKTTANYEQAVIKAVNGGDDADTVGAVTGMIAGAFYGLSSIPDRWLAVLKDRAKIIELGTKLFELGSSL